MTGVAIQSETMRCPSQDGTMINAYLSRPATPGNHPGVIVAAETFGLVEHIEDAARRFAAQGYTALALDLYTKEGAPDPDNMDEVISKMFSAPDSQVLADLEGLLHP